MSRLHVECPACKGVFNVKAFRAGHRVACKLCGGVVRVPTDGVLIPDPNADPAPEPAIDESTRETRPVLKRMSFADAASDAVYDDIFADTDEALPKDAKPRGPRLTIPRPILVRIGLGLSILLALYVAYRAGRNSGPAVPVVPSPVVAPTGETPKSAP